MIPHIELEMSGGRVCSKFCHHGVDNDAVCGFIDNEKDYFPQSRGDSDSEYDDNNFIQSKATAAGPFSPYPPETTAQLQTNTESIQVNNYEDEGDQHINLFLAVQNRSIGDLVTDSLTD